MSCAVEVTIRATPDTIWRLLTDAADFPRWNSTVESIEGEIREGQRVQVRVPDVDRVFRLKVSDVVQNERMRWSDGFAPMFQGVRDFRLSPRGDGSTHFSMVERFSGLMLPMIRGSLPDFGPAFERYARDLQAEAERA
jgi:uncharacterized protein YndB with AHSA1/START domain